MLRSIWPYVAASALVAGGMALWINNDIEEQRCIQGIEGRDELEGLHVEKAEEDARRAVAADDTRLIATAGEGPVLYPGTTGENATLHTRYGTRLLHAVFDVVECTTDRRLKDNARDYAAIYNKTVIELVGR